MMKNKNILYLFNLFILCFIMISFLSGNGDGNENIMIMQNANNFLDAWKNNDYISMLKMSSYNNKMTIDDFKSIFLIKIPDYEDKYFHPSSFKINEIKEDSEQNRFNIYFTCEFNTKELFKNIFKLYIDPQSNCKLINKLKDEVFNDNSQYLNILFLNEIIVWERNFKRENGSYLGIYKVIIDENDSPNQIVISGGNNKWILFPLIINTNNRSKFVVPLNGSFDIKMIEGKFIITNFLQNKEDTVISKEINISGRAISNEDKKEIIQNFNFLTRNCN